MSASSFLSSDRDSLSSSTDGEEDLSSAETSEVFTWTHMSTHGNTLAYTRTHTLDFFLNCFAFAQELREPDESTQMTPACDPPNTELPENVPDLMRDQSDTQMCTRKHKVCTHWPLLNIHFVHLFLNCLVISPVCPGLCSCSVSTCSRWR